MAYLGESAALIVGLVLVLSAVGTMSAVHERASLEATATVEDVTVDNGSISSITLRIRNHGTKPISPVFRVQSANWSVPNAWPADGPQTLEPGETATYTVTAPGPETRPLAGRELLVRVGNRGEQAWLTERYRTEVS